jgi:DNA mismatch endonuclease (patch repair protein)
VDKLTSERRSENMGRIRSTDTNPEVKVRRFLHSQGLRFRLHDRRLPGKPDLVFPALNTCVFVHGCFWHGCPKCIDGTRRVRSRTEYWGPKIENNRRRDAEHNKALRALGWRVLVIWDCELATPAKLRRVAKTLLELKSGRTASGSRRRRARQAR